ncbi:FRG domain-containing protein [Sanguibacter sp. 25GB23B1]|uniref:FRG domain-containing protein n=1 Tax=unclassified Sanguibacter TaxID=2645534 RepID=UPI0032AED112
MTEPPSFTSWTSHDVGIKVQTPEELFRIISHIALLSSGRTYAWRGQRDASWNFDSLLYRDTREADETRPVTEKLLRERELVILDEARRWGLGRDLGSSATDMHLLAVLQHHGVPTRLIDVTSNPMTALWFATEEHPPDKSGRVAETDGVLFAVDVTDTDWYQTFQHEGNQTWGKLESPMSGAYNTALEKSESSGMFRAFPALPDDRMRAQEGFFLGSKVPEKHTQPGVLGLNPIGAAAGQSKLQKLLESDRGRGRPSNLPFCAVVIPNTVKRKIRGPLKRTYNRRRRVLFPDVDGFRDALKRNQLD